MNKKNLLNIILSILLVVYMVVAFSFTAYIYQNDYCKGVDVKINNPSNMEFITVDDILREIGNEDGVFLSMRLNEINTHTIETSLNAIDKIEEANCFISKEGHLKIDITPLIPVARIFDPNGTYYINRDGKKMTASARYHVDVPVVVGQFNSKLNSTAILPLLKYIKSDSTWNSLVSGIKIDANNDIIIAPMIKGHVLNLGDTSDIENKFARINTIYKQVLPIKGWTFYDTISVKWQGQVVATRKDKHKVVNTATFADSIDEEAPSLSSMNVSYERNIPVAPKTTVEEEKNETDSLTTKSPKAKKKTKKSKGVKSKKETKKENNKKPN